MDGLSIFRKLAVGAKFNFKRFQADAEKLQVSRVMYYKKNMSTLWKDIFNAFELSDKV